MSTRYVLVVEDSPTMHQIIKLALRRVAGIQLLSAQNGAQALELVRQQPVDLILLDLNMPVMSGFAFLEHLAEVPVESRPPVIVITTRGDEGSIERAQKLGVNNYLTKPLQSASLSTMLEKLLPA